MLKSKYPDNHGKPSNNVTKSQMHFFFFLVRMITSLSRYIWLSFYGPALLWSPDRYSAQLLLHLSPLLPALLGFILQGSFVWAKTFLPLQRRVKRGCTGWAGWRMKGQVRDEWDCCNTSSIIHVQLWMTLEKTRQTLCREPGCTDVGAVAAVRKGCLVSNDQKLPWEVKQWRVFIFTLLLHEWWLQKWLISSQG